MKALKFRLSPLLFVPCLGLAQTETNAPTALEAFVASPTVVVERERLLGQFRGRESTISIHALEAADRSSPGVTATGARVDVVTNAWRDSVFLDPEQLSLLSADLISIRRAHERFEAGPDPSLGIGRQSTGTGDCWMPREPQRILCPNYSIQNGFQSAWINLYGSDEKYPIAPSELETLAVIFQTAREDLASGVLFEVPDESEKPVVVERARETDSETLRGPDAITDYKRILEKSAGDKIFRRQ